MAPYDGRNDASNECEQYNTIIHGGIEANMAPPWEEQSAMTVDSP
jgi:hypothetical protein